MASLMLKAATFSKNLTLTWHRTTEHHSDIFTILFAGAEDKTGLFRNHF